MSYRERFIRTTGWIFVGLMVTGLFCTWNGTVTVIGTAIVAALIARIAVPRVQA